MTGISKSENQETATSGMQSVQMQGKARNVSHAKTFQAMTDAIGYMNRLIKADVDYPEAQWRASQVYPQFTDAELQSAYDSQDEWL